MSVLTEQASAPRLICGIHRTEAGPENPHRLPLACILDMGHDGNTHRDRMGRTWEIPAQYTTRAYVTDVIQRLVTLHAGTIGVLDNIARTAPNIDGGHQFLAHLAATERARVTATWAAMGLTEDTADLLDQVQRELDEVAADTFRPVDGAA